MLFTKNVNIPAVKKWIRALRSNKYKQGRGALRQINSNGEVEYCCLGVACDLSPSFKWVLRPNAINQFKPKDVDGKYSYGILPISVMHFLGISSRCGEVYNKNGYPTSLTTMNDTYPMSFKYIADVIEKELQEVIKTLKP